MKIKKKEQIKCPICSPTYNENMEEIGNIKHAKIYFRRKFNDNKMKKKLKTRIVWMDDGEELAEYKLIDTGVKFR